MLSVHVLTEKTKQRFRQRPFLLLCGPLYCFIRKDENL